MRVFGVGQAAGMSREWSVWRPEQAAGGFITADKSHVGARRFWRDRSELCLFYYGHKKT